MSILSEIPDGCGFHYGYAKPDMRRIDVRWVADMERAQPFCGYYEVYIAGEKVAERRTKAEAEEAAIAWLRSNLSLPPDAEAYDGVAG